MYPGKEDNGASIFGNADIIKQTNKRQSFLSNALTPILRRYPYESQIAGWVLINEPENAIKQGFLSSDAIQEFTHEAATLIKQTTHRQPVSIASADLESLVEYSGKNAGDLDFFVFHHYEQYLPPPVSRVRDLMVGGDDKPIYIGEFDIDNPPAPIAELVTWAQALGYAGIWPWSANPEANRDPKKAAASSLGQNVLAISEVITATNPGITQLRQEFETRAELPSGLTPSFDHALDWWIDHWSTVAKPKIVENRKQWTTNTSLEGRKYEENRRWESDKAEWLAMLAKRKSERQLELVKADKSLRENEVSNDLRGITESRNWVEKVKGELRDLEAEIRNQEEDLQTARERMALHLALSNYYRYKAKWVAALYQEFWEAETARKERVGWR